MEVSDHTLESVTFVTNVKQTLTSVRKKIELNRNAYFLKVSGIIIIDSESILKDGEYILNYPELRT